EEAQRIRLGATFLMCAGERQRPRGEGLRLLQAASQQMRLNQRETTERLKVNLCCCHRLFDRLREQCHGIGDAPAEGIRRAQGRSRPGQIGREVRVLTDTYSSFEQGERPPQATLPAEQRTKSVRGKPEPPSIRSRLGIAKSFVPESMALSECAQLGMALGEIGTGGYVAQVEITSWSHLDGVLAAPHPVEERHVLPLAVDRPTIVALVLVGDAKVVIRPCLTAAIPARDGEREGALGG